MLPQKNRRFIFNCLGVFLGIFGLLYSINSEAILEKILQMNIVLHPTSDVYELWKNPPVKLTLNMYLFNWTNPEDFNNVNVKPKFVEMGPYAFVEVPDKVNIHWHAENASVTYRKKSRFFFDAENSVGSLNDKIVNVNALAVSLSSKAKRWSPLRRKMIDIALRLYQNEISVKKTAHELLFGGYEDPLLNIANIIPSSLTDVVAPFDKFGYAYPRNDSSTISGIFNIYTGADDIKKLGQMHTWNYQQSTNYYPSQCSKVYGSPGELQTPGLKENEPINFFLPDFCRSASMDFVEKVQVEGVEGFRYEGGLRFIDNGTLYPENECHCNGECVPSGVINASACWFGSPVFMSYPHFYAADPYYLDQIEGMKPEKERHELYTVLDKRTGFTLDIAARLQANLLINPISEFSMFENDRRLFFPIMWFEEKTRITPELSILFKIIPHVILFGQVFGALCCLTGLLLLAWHPLMKFLDLQLMQQIKISDLERDQQRITHKSDTPDVSPLLKRIDINVNILENTLSVGSESKDSGLSDSPMRCDLSEPIRDYSYA